MGAARQHGPGAQAGRIGSATLGGDVIGGGGAGVVPNAAQSWSLVSDVIPSTYLRSGGLSGRSTDARVGVERTERWPEPTAEVAESASAITSTTAASATFPCDRTPGGPPYECED